MPFVRSGTWYGRNLGAKIRNFIELETSRLKKVLCIYTKNAPQPSRIAMQSEMYSLRRAFLTLRSGMPTGEGDVRWIT